MRTVIDMLSLRLMAVIDADCRVRRRSLTSRTFAVSRTRKSATSAGS